MYKENMYNLFHAMHIMCLIHEYIFGSDIYVLSRLCGVLSAEDHFFLSVFPSFAYCSSVKYGFLRDFLCVGMTIVVSSW